MEAATPASLRTMPVRDSKNPDQPYPSFSADQWRAFIATVKGGDRS
ncbi:DUF397 domain-containing protein [Allonocardiopsis opalescens]|nr:DUF397 domain-containing protein [Allonocardiopsis opalescens]